AQVESSLRILYLGRGIDPPTPQLGAPAVVNWARLLQPSGWASSRPGTASRESLTRQVFAGAGQSKLACGSAPIFHRDHYPDLTGLAGEGFGLQRVEHYRRTLLAPGFSQLGYGTPLVSLRNRTLAPPSIFTAFASAHLVGGLRFLLPAGFDAAQFG